MSFQQKILKTFPMLQENILCNKKEKELCTGHSNWLLT